MARMNSKWFLRYRCQSYSKSRGAVLLAVLVLMMILSFMLLSLSSVLESRLAIAQSSSQLLKDKAAAYAKLQELIYMVGTQRTTRAGVSTGVNVAGSVKRDGHWILRVTGDEIRFDGFVYKEDNGLAYSLQNEAGLIAINSSDQMWLKRWLSAHGNALGATNMLADTLHDYADGDSWKRPLGAELKDYINAGLPPPSNFLLQSCTELNAVMGWAEFIQLRPDIINQCSLSRLSYLNINAVPEALWQKLWPNSAAQVKQLRRNGKWFIVSDDILSLEPAMLTTPDDYYRVLGGDTFIIRVAVGSADYTQRIEIGRRKTPPYALKAMPLLTRTGVYTP